MPVYPLFYGADSVFTAIPGKSYNTDTKQIVDTPAPTPTPPVTGRSFDLPLGIISGTKNFGYRHGDMIIRGDGRVVFNSGYCSMQGPAPRIYVYDTQRLKKWKNLEVIVEYMRVREDSPPSYAGLGIGVRSIHEIQTSQTLKVPTYYLKHTFDGRFFFEKETVHGQTYTKQPNSQDKSYPMERSKWYAIRFLVNGDELRGYQWVNGQWVLRRAMRDTGQWNGSPILEGTSCFIRTDSVSDFRVRKFSIREIV